MSIPFLTLSLSTLQALYSEFILMIDIIVVFDINSLKLALNDYFSIVTSASIGNVTTLYPFSLTMWQNLPSISGLT